VLIGHLTSILEENEKNINKHQIIRSNNMKTIFSSLTAASALAIAMLGTAISPAKADACSTCMTGLTTYNYNDSGCSYNLKTISGQMARTDLSAPFDSTLTPQCDSASDIKTLFERVCRNHEFPYTDSCINNVVKSTYQCGPGDGGEVGTDAVTLTCGTKTAK
jgi:hypothetical protein